MQQEHLTKLRLLAISEINRALDNCLDNCRKVLDHSRKIGLPVAFIRMLNESAFSRNALRRVGQSRTRRCVGGRNPPRRFENIRALWRGL